MPIPKEHILEGIDADLIIYITAKNESKNETYLAWASPCLRNSLFGRPIAGIINYNTARFNVSSIQDIRFMTEITIHEVIKILILNKIKNFFFF